MLPKFERLPSRTCAKHGAALALAAWIVSAGGVVSAQQPTAPKPQQSDPAKAGTGAGAKVVEGRRPDVDLDQKVNQAREEIEILQLQLETKRAQCRLAEARLAESKRWKGLFEKLWKDGMASEERYVAARDDVLMHESRVTAEKAGVEEAELRVKQAQRRLAYGEFPLVPQDGRMAEMEQRLGSLEKTLDMLQQEVGSLKRMIRYRWKDPDKADPPPLRPAP